MGVLSVCRVHARRDKHYGKCGFEQCNGKWTSAATKGFDSYIYVKGQGTSLSGTTRLSETTPLGGTAPQPSKGNVGTFHLVFSLATFNSCINKPITNIICRGLLLCIELGYFVDELLA